jgi:Nitrous oxide-stimulated promoter
MAQIGEVRQDLPVSAVPGEFQNVLLTTPRLRREQRTIEAMIRIWCEANPLHVRVRFGGLCAGCDSLLDYASYRLLKCPYGEEKPTCKKCPIHCYTRAKRDLMQEVMRFAGPRMLLRHPILAYHHLRDEKRTAPPLTREQRPLGAT